MKTSATIPHAELAADRQILGQGQLRQHRGGLVRRLQAVCSARISLATWSGETVSVWSTMFCSMVWVWVCRAVASLHRRSARWRNRTGCPEWSAGPLAASGWSRCAGSAPRSGRPNWSPVGEVVNAANTAIDLQLRCGSPARWPARRIAPSRDVSIRAVRGRARRARPGIAGVPGDGVRRRPLTSDVADPSGEPPTRSGGWIAVTVPLEAERCECGRVANS